MTRFIDRLTTCPKDIEFSELIFFMTDPNLDLKIFRNSRKIVIVREMISNGQLAALIWSVTVISEHLINQIPPKGGVGGHVILKRIMGCSYQQPNESFMI